MKVTIKGTPEEIKKVLQAITGSSEHKKLKHESLEDKLAKALSLNDQEPLR